MLNRGSNLEIGTLCFSVLMGIVRLLTALQSGLARMRWIVCLETTVPSSQTRAVRQSCESSPPYFSNTSWRLSFAVSNFDGFALHVQKLGTRDQTARRIMRRTRNRRGAQETLLSQLARPIHGLHVLQRRTAGQELRLPHLRHGLSPKPFSV